MPPLWVQRPMPPREDWEKFPIVIDGVLETEMGEPVPLPVPDPPNLGDVAPLYHFNQIADAVARWINFVPYIADANLSVPGAALNSFGWDLYKQNIDAAKAAGLRLIWGLSWTTQDLTLVGNDGDPLDGQMWTKKQPKVLIPTGIAADIIQNQITDGFLTYWSARANVFIPWAALYSDQQGDVLWGWRVIEEPKYIEGKDVELSKRMRDLTNLHDNGRFRFVYNGTNYMPNAGLLWSLIEKGSQYYPLNPNNPVARSDNGVDIDGVESFYGSPGKQNLKVRLSGAMRQVQMFDHVMAGAYMETIRDWGKPKDYTPAPAPPPVSMADENRIWVYHRIRLGREALVNLKSVYAQTYEKAPDHILFHVPGLLYTQYIPGGMKAEHARHDLWAGVHEAEGIWLYSSSYRNTHPNAWLEYVKALYLIKQTIRPYIIDGVKSHPANNAMPYLIAPDYYTSKVTDKFDHVALPDGAQQYTAINLTLFRKGSIGYLIATNSYRTLQDLEVTLDDPILSVEVVSGITQFLDWNNWTLRDAFSGIDGRVYKITFG